MESADFWNKKCRDFFKNERDIFKTFSSSACRAAFAINYSMRVYAARVFLSLSPSLFRLPLARFSLRLTKRSLRMRRRNRTLRTLLQIRQIARCRSLLVEAVRVCGIYRAVRDRLGSVSPPACRRGRPRTRKSLLPGRGRDGLFLVPDAEEGRQGQG